MCKILISVSAVGMCALDVTVVALLSTTRLSSNQLQTLPAAMESCKDTLSRLDISENPLVTLPPVVMTITHLQKIFANNTLLEELPQNIG